MHARDKNYVSFITFLAINIEQLYLENPGRILYKKTNFYLLESISKLSLC